MGRALSPHRARFRAASSRLPQPRIHANGRRTGFTLLEVILALAILAVAVGILSEAIRLAYSNGSASAAETRAQLLAASKLAEVITGIVPLTPLDRAPVETEEGWLYSIEVQPLEIEGLLAVKVTVSQDLPQAQRPVEYSISRWLPDPDFAAAASPGQSQPETPSAQTPSGDDRG